MHCEGDRPTFGAEFPAQYLTLKIDDKPSGANLGTHEYSGADLDVFDANELKDRHRWIYATVTSDLAALVTANHAVLLLLDEDVSILEVDRVEEASKEERKKDVALLLDFHGDLVRLFVLSVHGLAL